MADTGTMTNGQAAASYYARRRNRMARTTTASDDKASRAYGTIHFPANPSSGATITLGGTVVHLGTDVTIGVDLATTMASLLTFLQASADVNISKCTYQNNNPDLFVQAKDAGVATFTLAASAATVSGATLKLMKINSRVAL
jgi:hypothetical protein